MGIEASFATINLLNTAWPLGSDTKATIDDHIRGIKTAITGTFTGITGVVTTTHTRLNYLTSAGGTTGTTSTNIVFSTGPTITNATLVTPALGTPSSGTLTSCTGLPVSTGISGLGTGVATALAVNVGSAGAPVVNGGALGSPSSAGTLPAFTLGGAVTLNGQTFSGAAVFSAGASFGGQISNSFSGNGSVAVSFANTHSGGYGPLMRGGGGGAGQYIALFADYAGSDKITFDENGNVKIANTASAPSTPTGAGILYVESGALKYRGSSGTITTIANA